jgi:hypothetical protein
VVIDVRSDAGRAIVLYCHCSNEASAASATRMLAERVGR